MPKYRGRVDCFMNPVADTSGIDSRTIGEMFVNIVQHISGCSDIGVEMIAANFGIAGTGFTFWDQGTIGAGHRSFAVFRFHSASQGKFDCMVFATTGSSVSNSPMSPGGFSISQAGSARGNIGIAFACHPSGSNTGSADGPWNGSYSLTSASIGLSGAFGGINNSNPVWKTNVDGKAAFFPRCNNIYGNNSGSRNFMALVNDDVAATTNTAPCRMHVVCSEDSVTILVDHLADTGYKVTHFGSYASRVGMTPRPESPYFYFTNAVQTNAPWGNTWATAQGQLTVANSTNDGAIAHPSLLSGSRISGIVLHAINNAISYNSFINSGSYERFPMYVAIDESNNVGILGTLNHISYGFGMASHTVTTNSSSAAFGTSTAATGKILIPWSGSQPGFQNGIRTGRTMSFDI